MLHLLKKHKILKKLQHTYAILRGFINSINMNENEGRMQEEERLDQGNFIGHLAMLPLQNLDVEEIGADVGMGVSDDSSSENEYEGGNDLAERGDNVDQDDSNYNELDENMDSSSSEDFESLTERRMYNISIKQQNLGKPAYSFQPLQLIKCLYKNCCRSSEYPIARSGHRITASESYLYSLGGYNPNSISNTMLFQELWAYNFATNRWKLIQNADNPDMPKELASNALVYYNNILISHGGTGFPFGESCSNDCYVYTTGQNPQVVLLKVSGDLPAEQYGSGIVIHKDYLYTIGGTTGYDYSCDVYRLNLITKVWEIVYICRPEMRDDPEGRYRHELVYDGHHIYVFGGGTANTVYDLQRIPAFNLETNLWDYFETLPDRTVSTTDDSGYPRARKCLSCVQHTLSNGDVEAFITGGLQGDFATYFNDIWKINLRTKQWYKIHSAFLPRPLYFHSAAHSGNGCMYIFGGIQYSEKDVCRRNDLFKMWMTIPKLSDICWDAITYYNNDLHYFDRSTLHRVGIPDRYVNRLPLQEQIQQQILHEPDEPSPSSLLRVLPKRMRSHTE